VRPAAPSRVATGRIRRDTASMTALPGHGPSDAQAPADARPAADDPVTVLYSRRVKPGREADFEAWARGIVAAARQFPGHLGASVLDAPGSREYHILFTFADRRSLRAWLDSDERRRWLVRVGELLEADRGLQQLTGLETWFKLPGSNVPTMTPPPRWKMWLVSLVAVYPLVLAFQVLVVPRMARLPLPLRALVFPLVLLTLMTFVVMPMVTRALRRWLGPRHDQEPVEGGL
jgi:antibiotic biosynthesis monooxygenase (ABM) superfamily enzyme